VSLKCFYCVATGTAVVGALFYVVYNGWVSSDADEWLLLIENG